MHRYADRSGLIGDRTGDRLTDPPSRICREFVSLCIVEFIDCADQTGISLLNQIQNVQAAAGVLLCDGDNQTQVGLRQLVFGALIPFSNAAGQLLLFFRREQGNLPDFLQVHADGIIQIELRRQLHGVHQRFFLLQIGGGKVDIIQQIRHRIPFGVGTDDLNTDRFKCIINLFDLIHRKIELFQGREQFRRGKDPISAALADQGGQRSHQFFIWLAAFF